MSAPNSFSLTNLWGGGVSVEFRIADGNTGNASLHTDHNPSANQYVYEFYYNGSPGGPGLTLIFKNTTSDNNTGFGTAYTGYQFVDLNLGQEPTDVFHHSNGNIQMKFSNLTATTPASDITFFNNYTPVSTGPTVTPATYDVPNDTSGRSSLQNLFRIYDLNLIKFGHKGYRVSFQHEDAPSTFNVYVCYTNTNNDPVEDQYSVNITTTNSNKTVYLTRSLTYLPKAGTIDIKFQTQATLAGNPNQTFLANTTMKSFTYVPNDLTVTFSPNVGTPGTTVTLSITGSDNTYVSTQEAYLIPPNWFEANVGTTTITKNNLGQFDYTNTFNVIEGTYNVTHPQGAQYNIANATYDANYVAPSTTSNGGGKPDRYPLIMTNLFNRNRSLYSIGMTHKDTWDLFL
jgi:hypothetical protein